MSLKAPFFFDSARKKASVPKAREKIFQDNEHEKSVFYLVLTGPGKHTYEGQMREGQKENRFIYISMVCCLCFLTPDHSLLAVCSISTLAHSNHILGTH